MTGEVVARDPATMKVRVQFAERDGLITDWLPVCQQKSKGDRSLWLPDMHSQVACMMDAHYEAGVVLGCIYSDEDPPPVVNPDIFYQEFADGTVISYDRLTHQLLANVNGSIAVQATGALVVNIDGNCTITTPTCTVNGALVVTGAITGGADITAANNVLDQGGAKSMAGMRQVYGNHVHGTSPLPTPGM